MSKEEVEEVSRETRKWLQERFENGPCEDCGGGAEDHAISVESGNLSAECRYPVPCTKCLRNQDLTRPARFLAPQGPEKDGAYNYIPVCARCFGVSPEELDDSEPVAAARIEWGGNYMVRVVPFQRK